MAQMVEGDREYGVSRESFRVVGGHVASAPSLFPLYFGWVLMCVICVRFRTHPAQD